MLCDDYSSGIAQLQNDEAIGLRPAEPTIPYSTVKQPTARAG